MFEEGAMKTVEGSRTERIFGFEYPRTAADERPGSMIQDCRPSEAIGRRAQPATRVSTDVSLPFLGNFPFLWFFGGEVSVPGKEGKGQG